jgi:hypothetical protein
VLGSEEKEPELNSGVLLLIITNEGVLILDWLQIAQEKIFNDLHFIWLTINISLNISD